MHFAKKYHLQCTAGRGNIIYKYIIHLLFSILDVVFAVPFLCYFQKLLLVKKIKVIFAALYFYLYVLKKSVSDF